MSDFLNRINENLVYLLKHEMLDCIVLIQRQNKKDFL